MIAEMFFKVPLEQLPTLATVNQNGTLEISYPIGISESDEIKKLISLTLVIDPMKRVSSANLLKYMD